MRACAVRLRVHRVHVHVPPCVRVGVRVCTYVRVCVQACVCTVCRVRVCVLTRACEHVDLLSKVGACQTSANPPNGKCALRGAP